MTTMRLLGLLSLLLSATAATNHIPFGYQSNSAASPIERREEGPRDPSSFAGAIHYDALHHALYMTGATFASTFDGSDAFNLQHEQDQWDLGVPSYTPKNGDCFYSVFKLPLDRQTWEFRPGNAVQGGISLLHSRRFGSRATPEACSAVDILPASVNQGALGGYIHEFETLQNYNQFPPTVSPRPSSAASYYPTYLPSVTARPTIPRGIVPEEFSPQLNSSTYSDGVGVTPDEMGDGDGVVDVQPDRTKSNIARKVRIEHLEAEVGIISLKEVQVYDSNGNNVAIGKTATQSTDYSSSHVASMANDGDLETFSHTASNGNSPWWEVDLGASIAIDTIHVVNRDCQSADCLARLSYATLSLVDESGKVVARRNFGDTSGQEELDFDFSVSDVVASDPSNPPPFVALESPIASPMGPAPTYLPTYLPSVTAKPTIGQLSVDNDISISNIAQKVRIQLPDSAGAGQLGIREVQVYDDNSVNVAVGKSATQSSDWSSTMMAPNAIDGNLDTFSNTANEASAWWEVDLGEMITITAITILNRWCQSDSNTDPCLGRMSYSTVSLIDDLGNVVATRNVGDTSGKGNIDFDFWFGFDGGDGTGVSSEGTSAIAPTQSSSTSLPSATTGPTPQQPSASNVWIAQKVRIQLPGVESSVPLSMKEVAVKDENGINVAIGKLATQSSDDSSGDHPASYAVDDNVDSFSQTSSDDVYAWWEVDLGGMYTISEIVIGNVKCPTTDDDPCLRRLSYSVLTLMDDLGGGVATIDIGDVSQKESIVLHPADSPLPLARKLPSGDFRKSPPKRPLISPMETRSVRLLIAGHVESINFDDGYIVEDLKDGQYDQANVYGFTQQVDIRLPLGALRDEPDFIHDLEIMNNPNANVNGLTYSLEEESLGGFVTSGVDAKALLNDHLRITLNTLYPVALVADSSSKKHYYVLILASDNAEVNDDGKDAALHQDTTIGSGANQQSWTDFDDFGVAGIINPGDLFGSKGRPRYGSDYRIVLKKMAIDSVDPSCITNVTRRGERRAQSVVPCKQFSQIEKLLSSTSYNRDTIVMSQEWVQEFKPDLGEDTRPAGLIFAPSEDFNTPDLLVMAGSTSGFGSAFGTNDEGDSGAGDSPQRFDLDGFVMKIRADDGGYAGKDAFDASTNSFTNMHSVRISSLPNKNDVVASLCITPPRDFGPPEPVDHVFVVGSTEGLLPGLVNGIRNETIVKNYPEETAVNSMEAFLMKVNLATMNPVWTAQIGAINLATELKGNAFGFGCAVTHDGMNVYLTGMVKDGGVVTDFSRDSLEKHGNVARGGTDVFIASYKVYDGTLNYLRQIGSTKDDTPSRGNGGITVDRIGNAIIVGNTRGSLMRQRNVEEYVFGQDRSEAASDIFIMSFERDTGEYAPISVDTGATVIPVDNDGVTQASDAGMASAANQQTNASTSTGASIFLVIILAVAIIGVVVGITVFAYKSRKRRQEKTKQLYRDSNLSPRGNNLNAHRRNTWGLEGKPGGSVLNQFEDMNIMVEVRNSISGGWQVDFDDDSIQQIDFGSSRAGGQDNVIEQSLFMEDGLQALEEIEKSTHNNFSISGEGEDDDDEEVTDEDLIQAYNEAMAIDIEPESEAVAALTKGLNMPNFGSELT
ncbi:hypothetical protein HJC23_004185 [Cyclotella cryptica]|uniref:F5/8 type C domain-containing protein n=1 Tax=Cyclotella cryptica TaxID=29204 RepID=A0ABD3Q7F2_9STRA